MTIYILINHMTRFKEKIDMILKKTQKLFGMIELEKSMQMIYLICYYQQIQ
ncbi:hypothetical protein Psal003_00512 [Piscirickettsia salmonis]|nr:hypothetical protein Psal003_00512 [Piscirickettsia salmonis]QGN86999.1 hypothetical protein Psal004_00511 [Piscirickettsia salmonis]